LFERDDIASQWVFKLNRAPASAQTWHLQGYMLKVTIDTS